MSKKLFSVLKKLTEDNPNLIVGGSLALKISGIKGRTVNDIDLIVPTFSEFEKLKEKYENYIGGDNSVNEEIDNDNTIFGFSCEFPNSEHPEKVKVDFLYNFIDPLLKHNNYDLPEYGIQNLKVSDIEDVIEAKFRFLETLKKISSFKKHILDILMLSQEMDECSDVININKRLEIVLSEADFWNFWDDEDSPRYDPHLLNSRMNKQIEDSFEDDLPF